MTKLIHGIHHVTALAGAPQKNVDFTLGKVFRITEKQNLRFRADFFNLFNHPQFAVNNLLDVSAPTSALVSSTSVNPRLIQLALKYFF